MLTFSHTIILRHRKENLKKCSLRGLEKREDIDFYTYPKDTLPDLSGYFLLALDASELTQEDANKGIFLIDGTWRYAEVMQKTIPAIECRSLPRNYLTAYPRRQDDSRGLASIEALFLTYHILGRNTEGLLDDYYWKEDFLNKNCLH